MRYLNFIQTKQRNSDPRTLLSRKYITYLRIKRIPRLENLEKFDPELESRPCIIGLIFEQVFILYIIYNFPNILHLEDNELHRNILPSQLRFKNNISKVGFISSK